eukprot:TRINITY_DN94047_c1_g2_i1.p2 TRINITY_DN94047_c1_g2~~TRINITY_DN94047_c1_g2_i1.p2  ORF type:complete len:54 (+),score=7.28 TRINITY_DN94047_c1_g2_i1:99-260(+)
MILSFDKLSSFLSAANVYNNPLNDTTGADNNSGKTKYNGIDININTGPTILNF